MRGLFLLLLVLGAAWAGCLDLDEPANRPLSGDDGRPLGERVRLVKVAEGLERPVFVTGMDGLLYVVEQAGRIQIVEDSKANGFRVGTLQATPFLDITDRVGSAGEEQGLLGLAFHPEWPQDPRVYVDYTDRRGDSVLAVFRASDDDMTVDPESEKVLLKVEQPFNNHNGGMLAFGPDGMLYWSLGDGGSGGDPNGNGQDPHSLLGTILRLDVDGEEGYEVPDDNPFADGDGGRPEVWLYGLRNPWRFSFSGDDLWIGDVGQNRYEEVSLVRREEQAGANLGWNGYEGSEVFDPSVAATLGDEVIMPVATYTRSSGHCAVTGGHVYDGTVRALAGHYVFADYCSGWVWALEKDAEAETGWRMGRLFETGRSVSSFGTDDAGELYLVDLSGDILVFLAR